MARSMEGDNSLIKDDNGKWEVARHVGGDSDRVGCNARRS
jgi:hypothetical protein